MNTVKPRLLAFLLCDGAMQVFGKWTVQGIFDRWQRYGKPITPEAPLLVDSQPAFIALANLHFNREFRIDIEIVDTMVEEGDSKGQVVGQGLVQGTSKAQGAGRIELFQTGLAVRNCKFTHPGKYDAVIYFNGEIVESRNLDVMDNVG